MHRIGGINIWVGNAKMDSQLLLLGVVHRKLLLTAVTKYRLGCADLILINSHPQLGIGAADDGAIQGNPHRLAAVGTIGEPKLYPIVLIPTGKGNIVAVTELPHPGGAEELGNCRILQ